MPLPSLVSTSCAVLPFFRYSYDFPYRLCKNDRKMLMDSTAHIQLTILMLFLCKNGLKIYVDSTTCVKHAILVVPLRKVYGKNQGV